MKKSASVLLLPLLLLPNFLFLFPNAIPVFALMVAQPTGQPLPAGTVTYDNTWNSTASLACPMSKAAPEPVVPLTGWSATLRIPTLLFEGKPEGPNITQAFAISANGTLAVSDGAGNAFSVGPPTGLPVGTPVYSLRGNGTTVYSNVLVTLGASTVANVTTVFSERTQFCQPAGLRIDTLRELQQAERLLHNDELRQSIGVLCLRP